MCRSSRTCLRSRRTGYYPLHCAGSQPFGVASELSLDRRSRTTCRSSWTCLGSRRTVYYPLHCTLFRVLLASQEPKDVLEQPNMSQIAEDGPTCSCQLISTAWMVWPGQERADRAHGGSSNVAARSSLRFFLSCFIAGPAGCGGEHAAHGCSGEADPAGQVA